MAMGKQRAKGKVATKSMRVHFNERGIHAIRRGS